MKVSILPAAAAMLAAGGCATSHSRAAPARAQFIAEADAICTTAEVKLRHVESRAARLGIPGSEPSEIRMRVAIERRATERLEKLPRPVAGRSLLGRWITARVVAATVAIDVAEAPPHEDLAALADVVRELSRERAAARGLARDYGLEVCAAEQ